MHQIPRAPPRSASAANNLQTNPSRTNNQRDQYLDRSASNSDTLSYNERSTSDGDGEIVESGQQMSEAEQKNYDKVNQVIQQFFVKAVLTIVSSRATLPQTFNRNGGLKQNKWFNVVLDDTDVLVEPVMEWRQIDAMATRPPPLCIEIYFDMKDLTNSQTLVVIDEQGKRWDVAEALNPPIESTARPPSRLGRTTQIVLERWRIEVGDKNSVAPADLKDPLPNVYKKAVVLFRSLYTYTRYLPAWKYYRRMAKQPANHPSLKLHYRIYNDDFKSPRRDTLGSLLYPSSEPVTDKYGFGPSNSPVGPLSISVTYRNNTDFRVDDAESLLSSHFMGIDDHYFKPSLGGAAQETGHVPGSLPVYRNRPQPNPDVSQAYGSMSTFHQVGANTGSSPISALRAARDMSTDSPAESPPQKLPPNHRTATGSKSSLRSVEGVAAFQRRPSVSFQPFKAGSLSSSPAPGAQVAPSPSSSLGRTPSLTHPRNRTSLNALPQAALRAPSLPNETAIASSASSSPKPAPINRYSSSFGHRRGRFSSGGGSKLEDDYLSSGKGSVASSAHPGSEILNEGEGASSSSIKTDDENISDFLKLLEQKKDLKSFNRNDAASRDASTRRTTVALSMYKGMRDANAALSDSMSSSLLLHRSSSSSSRQLSNVPAMIAGASVSTSSSPGKPISPHTPHTPAIPSRLSANSIIEYEPPNPERSQAPARSRRTNQVASSEESTETATHEQGTTAIDIPTSPRPWPYVRRSSSAAAHRALDDEPDLYGMRSASLPVDERPDLSLSELLQLHEPVTPAVQPMNAPGDAAQLADQPLGSSESRPESREGGPRLSSEAPFPFRSRGMRDTARGRGLSSNHGSSSSLAAAATGRVSRYSFSSRPTTAVDDDEPLLFTMSELGAQSRRSLEEGRGVSNAGSGTSERRRGGSPWQ